MWKPLNDKLINCFKIETTFNGEEKLNGNPLLPYVILKTLYQTRNTNLQKEYVSALIQNITARFDRCVQNGNTNSN